MSYMLGSMHTRYILKKVLILRLVLVVNLYLPDYLWNDYLEYEASQITSGRHLSHQYEGVNIAKAKGISCLTIVYLSAITIVSTITFGSRSAWTI